MNRYVYKLKVEKQLQGRKVGRGYNDGCSDNKQMNISTKEIGKESKREREIIRKIRWTRNKLRII